MTRSGSSASAMLAVLRRQLRRDGWTMVRLARELGVGEATVKRWLAGRGLTIDRLDGMARLCGLTLGDLARAAEDAPGDLAQELTLAQEKALSANIFLSFLFMTILNGVQPMESAADFGVPPETMERALARLERLALIDRMPRGRVRPLIDRTMVFRKLPLRALFEQHMKQIFFELDYSAPDTAYVAEVVKLSRAGKAQLAQLMEAFRGQVQSLADRDAQGSAASRQWVGMLCVMRELDLSPIRDAQWDLG